MKMKLIFIGLCLLFAGFGLHNLVLAITTTPSVKSIISPTIKITPTTSAKTQQIEDLKDRLATKVAELKTRERKAVTGTIKSISVTTIIIETLTKDLKIERTDEIVVYKTAKGSNTKYDTDILAKGDRVVMFGYYDSTLDLLDAKIVVVQPISMINVAGTVKEIDRADFTLTLNLYSGHELLVDIETTTKTNQVNAEGKNEKYGFSKIQVGDRVQIIGSPSAKEENRMSANRILTINNQAINTPTSTVEATKITPSLPPSSTAKAL